MVRLVFLVVWRIWAIAGHGHSQSSHTQTLVYYLNGLLAQYCNHKQAGLLQCKTTVRDCGYIAVPIFSVSVKRMMSDFVSVSWWSVYVCVWLGGVFMSGCKIYLPPPDSGGPVEGDSEYVTSLQAADSVAGRETAEAEVCSALLCTDAGQRALEALRHRTHNLQYGNALLCCHRATRLLVSVKMRMPGQSCLQTLLRALNK